MPQYHGAQFGTFHITTNAEGRVPWCTFEKAPATLIDILCMTKNMQQAKLFAFCILPDHVHLLISPGPKGLSKFMHAFKKESARDIAITHRGMPFTTKWQKGYFDERIRTAKQLSNVVAYIQGNAVKHRLVNDITDWPWTSLHFPNVLDPMELWLD